MRGKKHFRRLSSLMKTKLLWEKMLILGFMSSEESDLNEEEVLILCPLPWRAEKVDTLLRKLDEITLKAVSSSSDKWRDVCLVLRVVDHPQVLQVFLHGQWFLIKLSHFKTATYMLWGIYVIYASCFFKSALIPQTVHVILYLSYILQWNPS